MAPATAAGPLAVRGGDVLGPRGWRRAEVTMRSGVIAAVGPDTAGSASAGRVLDATGLLVAPGFVDLQCNGAFGVDLAREPERVGEVAAQLPEAGVTAWCPTLVTSPPDRLDRLRRAVAACAGGPGAARVLGLHLEGPLLAPERRGAHPAALLRVPRSVDVTSWTRGAGVALVTLAPELPGALELVARLRRAGVTVSAGHTAATPAQLDAAWATGVRMVTHLCNGMPPFHHRAPGPVGWALGHRRVVAGVIADGAHLDPTAVAAVCAALGPTRTLLVSDAVAPAGLAGAAAVATLADGTLAGATTLLDACVRNLVACTGWPSAAAVRAATAVPARVLARRDRGRIAPGCVAELTLLTPDLHVAGTVIGDVVSAGLRDRLGRRR
jgi:N-acetylglucosamine-6-phosphate deacetylase